MNSKETGDVILLAHGDGGLLTHQLIEKYFLPQFKNRFLETLTDSATFPSKSGKMAITTDSFVVDPIFFPGGDIGKLAVCGTVNDLAVSGAKPLYLTASFIIEEGFPLSDLKKIVISMAKTCREINLPIIAGDTKVVGKGQADKIYITTTGVGYILDEARLGYNRIKPGDSVIVNGTIGNHGLSILVERESFRFDTAIISDCAPLNGIIQKLLKRFEGIKFMRDLTRGGLATNAKEIAVAAGFDIWLDETDIPIKKEVKGITEMLGLDPLYLANEGTFLTVVSNKDAEGVIQLLKKHPLGKDSAIIGRVSKGKGDGDVFLKTQLGGSRRLSMLTGAPLPRIC